MKFISHNALLAGILSITKKACFYNVAFKRQYQATQTQKFKFGKNNFTSERDFSFLESHSKKKIKLKFLLFFFRGFKGGQKIDRIVELIFCVCVKKFNI